MFPFLGDFAYGPAQGGTDGNDRDRTDSTYDDARDLYTNEAFTEQSSPTSTKYKDDYLIWQDSIATSRRVGVFCSSARRGDPLPNPPPVRTC